MAVTHSKQAPGCGRLEPGLWGGKVRRREVTRQGGYGSNGGFIGPETERVQKGSTRARLHLPRPLPNARGFLSHVSLPPSLCVTQAAPCACVREARAGRRPSRHQIVFTHTPCPQICAWPGRRPRHTDGRQVHRTGRGRFTQRQPRWKRQRRRRQRRRCRHPWWRWVVRHPMPAPGQACGLACLEVRTGETTSPASDRSKWWSVVSMNAAASSSLTKSSSVITHGPPGGREWTVARSSGLAMAASNMAWIPPLVLAGAVRPAHAGLTQPQELHESAHCVRMKPALASHSPLFAQPSQARCSSRHGRSGSGSCTRD